MIAAALKPPSRKTRTASESSFRDQMIAAALKPVEGRQSFRDLGDFPRSADRGRIEAADLAAEGIARCGFPRSADRGRIEASAVGMVSVITVSSQSHCNRLLRHAFSVQVIACHDILSSYPAIVSEDFESSMAYPVELVMDKVLPILPGAR